jgi:hypothetical protein
VSLNIKALKFGNKTLEKKATLQVSTLFQNQNKTMGVCVDSIVINNEISRSKNSILGEKIQHEFFKKFLINTSCLFILTDTLQVRKSELISLNSQEESQYSERS